MGVHIGEKVQLYLFIGTMTQGIGNELCSEIGTPDSDDDGMPERFAGAAGHPAGMHIVREAGNASVDVVQTGFYISAVNHYRVL